MDFLDPSETSWNGMDTFELHSKQPPRTSAGSSCANTPPLHPPPSMSIQTPLPFPGSGSLQQSHGPRFIFPTVSPARQVPRTPSTRMPAPSFQSFLAQKGTFCLSFFSLTSRAQCFFRSVFSFLIFPTA